MFDFWCKILKFEEISRNDNIHKIRTKLFISHLFIGKGKTNNSVEDKVNKFTKMTKNWKVWITTKEICLLFTKIGTLINPWKQKSSKNLSNYFSTLIRLFLIYHSQLCAEYIDRKKMSEQKKPENIVLTSTKRDRNNESAIYTLTFGILRLQNCPYIIWRIDLSRELWISFHQCWKVLLGIIFFVLLKNIGFSGKLKFYLHYSFWLVNIWLTCFFWHFFLRKRNSNFTFHLYLKRS